MAIRQNQRHTFEKSVNLLPSYYKERALVRADPTQIEQVLFNFFINAHHAMTIMREKEDKWGGDLNIKVDKFPNTDYLRKVHPETAEKVYPQCNGLILVVDDDKVIRYIADEMLKLGAFGFIQKPYTIEKLIDLVCNITA